MTYRVRYYSSTGDVLIYTDDLQDALDTARLLMSECGALWAVVKPS